MGRLTYVCATCSEHFTRKYSGTRHNLTIHNGRGEIVRLLEYLLGRSSGQYMPSHPFWYRRNRKWKTPTTHNFKNVFRLADSGGDMFRQGDGLQQESRDVNYPSNGTMHKTFDQPYGTQSQERRLKIIELKTLLDKCHLPYGDIILRRAVYESSNGDTDYLDEKLTWIRKIDKLRNRFSNTGISIKDRNTSSTVEQQ
jgi:hypothetical protein